jgi:hypothetical protein
MSLEYLWAKLVMLILIMGFAGQVQSFRGPNMARRLFVVHAWFRLYRVYHGFGKAKFAYGGLILGSSQFTLLPQLPLKTRLDLKVVKIDPKNNHLPSLI